MILGFGVYLDPNRMSNICLSGSFLEDLGHCFTYVGGPGRVVPKKL